MRGQCAVREEEQLLVRVGEQTGQAHVAGVRRAVALGEQCAPSLVAACEAVEACGGRGVARCGAHRAPSAVRVVPAPGRVDGVRHFVREERAERAVLQVHWRVAFIERQLQQAGGAHDRIVECAVRGAGVGRSARAERAGRQLAAEERPCVLVRVHARVEHVGPVRVADVQVGVPCLDGVGVHGVGLRRRADVRLQTMQLGACVGARGGIEPRQVR